MSHSRGFVEDDKYLVRYLLGNLPDEDAQRLDERSIVDDEFANRLRIVEDDLVDAYVAGALDPDTRGRFESVYFATPLRRQKVKFAERFLRAVDRQPVPGSDAVPALLRRRRTWLPLAAAVLLVACSVLLVQDIRLRRGLDEARRQGAALNERALALSGQLDDQRAANNTLAKELDRAHALRPPAIALVLMPQTRSAAPLPAIAIAPGVDSVPFDLQLDTADHSRYAVALRDPATDRIVWRSGAIAPRSSARASVVSIAVPGVLFKPQHYSFELSGADAAGRFDIVGSYAFQVEGK